MERVPNTNMVDIAEQRYAKELKKATYYVDEIKESWVREDLRAKQDNRNRSGRGERRHVRRREDL